MDGCCSKINPPEIPRQIEVSFMGVGDRKVFLNMFVKRACTHNSLRLKFSFVNSVISGWGSSSSTCFILKHSFKVLSMIVVMLNSRLMFYTAPL